MQKEPNQGGKDLARNGSNGTGYSRLLEEAQAAFYAEMRHGNREVLGRPGKETRILLEAAASMEQVLVRGIKTGTQLAKLG